MMNLIGFDLKDEKRGIREFKILVEAADVETAIPKLHEQFVEWTRKTITPPGPPGTKPAEVARTLINRVRLSADPMGTVLTIHLYTEFWLDRILDKNSASAKVRNGKYSQKLTWCESKGLLTSDIFHNLTRLNELRNKVAHDLWFDLSKMSLDYRGCPEHFEMSGYTPTYAADGAQHHVMNVLSGVFAQTYWLLHWHCVNKLGFTS